MSATIELTHATVLFTDRGEGDVGRTAGPAHAEILASRAAIVERYHVSSVNAAHQVHEASVITVAGGSGYRVGPAKADGLLTTSRNTAIAVHVADCLPIAIAGEGGVAIVHAGWRGLAAGVLAHGVAALREAGVAGGLEAAIGPGARGCCYEAGAEVHALFSGYAASHAQHLDLAAVAAAQLLDAGVHVISDLGACTLCAPAGLYFSHRRDGADTGRQAGIAWLR